LDFDDRNFFCGIFRNVGWNTDRGHYNPDLTDFSDYHVLAATTNQREFSRQVFCSKLQVLHEDTND